MKSGSTGNGPIRARKRPVAAVAVAVPETVPLQPPERGASTGTVDDDDEPEDEHDGENEASVGETHDDAEAR